MKALRWGFGRLAFEQFCVWKSCKFGKLIISFLDFFAGKFVILKLDVSMIAIPLRSSHIPILLSRLALHLPFTPD